MTQLVDWIQISSDLFNQSTQRIIWNLFLAFIPLRLSFYLFRLTVMRNFLWWILLLIFVAFLPNALYILTDSIHLIELSQKNYPYWAIILILIPQYTLFIILGFEAYAISLTKMDNYLINFISSKYLILVNIITHSLCIVGVYLGRFERFNSWDLVTKPKIVLFTTMENLFEPKKLLSMTIAFALVWGLTRFIQFANQRIISRVVPSKIQS